MKHKRIADTKKVLCSTARPDGTGEQGPIEILRKKLESGAPMTKQEIRDYASLMAITGDRRKKRQPKQPKPGFVIIPFAGGEMEVQREIAEAAKYKILR